MEIEKPLEEYTEDELREMFIGMFFWVADNRPEWLQEAIARKKKMLTKKEMRKHVSSNRERRIRQDA